MQKVSTGDLIHVYGGLGLSIDYNVRLCVKLKDEIDRDMLLDATAKTQKRYPYLSLRLCKKYDEVYFEENTLQVMVLNTQDRISLNSPQSNNHLWAVCFYEKTLYLDIYHGIADGTGMYMVLSTLLYYYCNKRYGLTDHEGIRTLDDEIDPLETVDPCDHLPEIDISKIPMNYEKAFDLIADGGMTPCKTRLLEIEIPEAAFVRYSSANDASPGIMVSILLARAIDKLFPERTAKLKSSYVINARPMLNAPKCHHNCVSTVFLEYSDKIKAMPFDRQCTAYRGKTFIQSDAERIAGAMTVSASRNKGIIKNMKTLEDKMATFAKSLMGGKVLFTFMVSYVGKWKYKPLEKYIDEFWTHVPNANNLLVEIAAVNGRIFLTIHQEFEEDDIINAFIKELDNNEITCTVREMTNDVAIFNRNF